MGAAGDAHAAMLPAAVDGGAPDGAPDGARPLRVILADDHPLVCRAIGDVAASVRPGTQVEEVGTLAALLASLRDNPEADLILLDLNLPDCSGFTGIRMLREKYPAIPVAIISALQEPAMIERSIKLGASAFIPKATALKDIHAAIITVLDGEIWRSAHLGVAAPADPGNLLPELTPAQMKIVSCLERGLLNKQIAFEIGVTEFTVKAHMTAAFRKLGVSNRTQAIMMLKHRRGDG